MSACCAQEGDSTRPEEITACALSDACVQAKRKGAFLLFFSVRRACWDDAAAAALSSSSQGLLGFRKALRERLASALFRARLPPARRGHR